MATTRTPSRTPASASPADDPIVREHRQRPLGASGDDAALMAGMVGGDTRAVAAVFQRHAPAVFGLAARVCGSDRADDVVQEVFSWLWREPHRFDATRGSLRTFLLSITHGRAVDVVRSDSARRHREVGDWLRRTPTGVVVDDAVLAALFQGDVTKVVLGLPPWERDAIVLAYFGGYTYREVAAILGHPEATIKSRIRRGLARLRVAMQDLTAGSEL